MQYIEMSELY